MKNSSKKKMLEKLLPKTRKQKRKQRNSNNVTTAKIGVVAVYLWTKTIPLLIGLTKISTASVKYAADLHIPLKDIILFVAKKKIG